MLALFIYWQPPDGMHVLKWSGETYLIHILCLLWLILPIPSEMGGETDQLPTCSPAVPHNPISL